METTKPKERLDFSSHALVYENDLLPYNILPYLKFKDLQQFAAVCKKNREAVSWELIRRGGTENPEIILSSGSCANHTILVMEKKAFASGENSNGQLGTGDKFRPSALLPALQQKSCSAWGKILQIYCGLGYTVILTKKELFVCGANDSGQLGLGDNSERLTFEPVERSFLNEDDEIQEISCGKKHTLIVTKKGVVYATGSNTSGQLGLGDELDRNTFTEVATVSEKILQIACGAAHTLMVTEKSVYATGYNAFGQLGTGDKLNKLVFTPVTIPADRILKVVCGQFHSLIASENHVYATGCNYSGQLGTKNNVAISTFTAVTLPGKIRHIACGDCHSVVITEQGIYTTGLNSCGQSGYYSTTKRNTNSFTAVALASKVLQITCSNARTTILDTNGFLFTWGSDDNCDSGAIERAQLLSKCVDAQIIAILSLMGFSMLSGLSLGLSPGIRMHLGPVFWCLAGMTAPVVVVLRAMICALREKNLMTPGDLITLSDSCNLLRQLNKSKEIGSSLSSLAGSRFSMFSSSNTQQQESKMMPLSSCTIL